MPEYHVRGEQGFSILSLMFIRVPLLGLRTSGFVAVMLCDQASKVLHLVLFSSQCGSLTCDMMSSPRLVFKKVIYLY